MRKAITLVVATLFITLYSFAQTEVTGKVTDPNGNPVEGVTVKEKGSSKGTSTDKNGSYTLKVKNLNTIIIFSSVGYGVKEMPLNGQSILNMNLKEASVELTGVEVVGSRSLRRSATETPVPIDIIPVSKVTNQVGQLDVNQILQYVAPSFNSNRQSGADGADHIDPATLRGLGPDQTLVLLNGKRYHQSALVNIFGSRGRGNSGTDLNSIPAAAIERIEILRDGASAQYGSDAIAGVINIVLKNTTNIATVNISTGTYVTGYGGSLKKSDAFSGKAFTSRADGGMLNMNFNTGFVVGKNGNFNITGDFLLKERTSRPNNPAFYNGRNEYGDAKQNNSSVYLNFSKPISKKVEFYTFGGYNNRNTSAYAYTRSATSNRNVIEIYPNGFDPKIDTKIKDGSLSFGIKTKTNNGWNIDFSNTFGVNRMNYFVKNSLNASLLTASPKEFDAGGFQLAQNVINFDMNKSFDKVMSGLNIAFGAEFRAENYQIFEGEEASWKTYTSPINPSLVKPGGAQGFQGFQPADRTNESRVNAGAYADVELNLTKKLLVTTAVRYEFYNDFKSTVNGKFSTRYKVSDKLSLRGSVSTGFRAPSLAQIYFRSTYTDVVGGNIIEKVIANNKGSLAQLVGIPKLKQETSLNASLGFTAKPTRNISLTVDGYYVKIKDRIVLTGEFGQDDDKIGDILSGLNVTAAKFFTNAVDTKTYGLDFIFAHNAILGKGKLATTLAFNYNYMSVEKINTTKLLQGKEEKYFEKRERYFLLASAPKYKANLNFVYTVGKWVPTLRFTYFDKIDIISFRVYGDGGPADAALAAGDYNRYNQLITDTYKAKIVMDFSIGYNITHKIFANIGGSNVLDTYPTIHDSEWTETGGMWDAVQMGFGGAFYYAKLNIRL